MTDRGTLFLIPVFVGTRSYVGYVYVHKREGKKKQLPGLATKLGRHNGLESDMISARKLFTMFFTSIDHVGNVQQDYNNVWTEEP